MSASVADRVRFGPRRWLFLLALVVVCVTFPLVVFCALFLFAGCRLFIARFSSPEGFVCFCSWIFGGFYFVYFRRLGSFGRGLFGSVCDSLTRKGLLVFQKPERVWLLTYWTHPSI
jgi:hypothetical protein